MPVVSMKILTTPWILEIISLHIHEFGYGDSFRPLEDWKLIEPIHKFLLRRHSMIG